MEAMEVRVSHLEETSRETRKELRSLHEAHVVGTAVQKETNKQLTAHAEEMKASTGMLTQGQMESQRRQDSIDQKLDRVLTYIDTRESRDEWTDHGAPRRGDAPSGVPAGHGFAAQLNSLDSRWIALIALALLVTGGVVSTTLAESIWQFFSGVP